MRAAAGSPDASRLGGEAPRRPRLAQHLLVDALVRTGNLRPGEAALDERSPAASRAAMMEATVGSAHAPANVRENSASGSPGRHRVRTT
jgi:hypothetical protein